jgi:hypothetical protein
MVKLPKPGDYVKIIDAEKSFLNGSKYNGKIVQLVQKDDLPLHLESIFSNIGYKNVVFFQSFDIPNNLLYLTPESYKTLNYYKTKLGKILYK